MGNQLLFPQASLAALVFFVFAGFWGTFIIAFVCEIAGRMNKRIFLDKLAMQMARLGTLIHIGTWLGLGALTLGLLYTQTDIVVPLREHPRVLLATLGLALIGTGVLITYFATWKRLRKEKKPVHMAIGLVGLVLTKPLFWIPALAVRSLALGEQGPIWPSIPPIGSMLWAVGIQWAFLAISMSAVLGSIYLLFRRNRDDFGRDYYKFALPVCAKWALFPFFGVLITCMWISLLAQSSVEIPGSTALTTALATRAASIILCVGIWLLIMKSATPLRYKGMVFVSGLLSWVFLLATIAALWEIIGKYSGLYIPHTFIADILTYFGIG
ncbi:hypothetical protein [Desulfoplanes sp.]